MKPIFYRLNVNSQVEVNNLLELRTTERERERESKKERERKSLVVVRAERLRIDIVSE